jgi:hypothetical protein
LDRHRSRAGEQPLHPLDARLRWPHLVLAGELPGPGRGAGRLRGGKPALELAGAGLACTGRERLRDRPAGDRRRVPVPAADHRCGRRLRLARRGLRSAYRGLPHCSPLARPPSPPGSAPWRWAATASTWA